MESIPVEFVNEGSFVRGRFFAADGPLPTATLLLFPGWPGDPDDVLGLGALLVQQGINVCMFNPRGVYQSDGMCTNPNTLQDIRSALLWLRQTDVKRQYKVDPARIILGGYSYGGGMGLAYAAQDTSVRRLISIAGNDHGEVAREIQRNAAFAEGLRNLMLSTRRPAGPAHFDYDAGIQEFIDHQEIYGLRENAARLADRSILLLGGWEDEDVTVDQFLLPFYRALRSAGAQKVTFIVYHTDHNFTNVRQKLATDIAGWIQQELGDE